MAIFDQEDSIAMTLHGYFVIHHWKAQTMPKEKTIS